MLAGPDDVPDTDRHRADVDRGAEAAIDSTLRMPAFAKLNLSLEIVGKRPDGLHEIVSVTQTISLADQIAVRPAGTLVIDMDPPLSAGETNLAQRAAERLATATCREPTGRLTITKNIPIAAGLGGGSSDAAAALILFDRLWGTGLGVEGLAPIAAELGSDVPLFLHGGASLIRGRGEIVEPLLEVPPFWLVLVCPPLSPPDKTRSLYRALRPEEWSDGAQTRALAERLHAGRSILEAPLVNAFDAAADRVYAGFPALRERLRALTGRTFYLTGAGPSLFTVVATEDKADEVRYQLLPHDLCAFIAQSVGRQRFSCAPDASPGRSGIDCP